MSGDLGHKVIEVVLFDFTTAVEVGDGAYYVHVPPLLDGMNLDYCHAQVIAAGTTNSTDVQIERVRSGSPVDMLSTKLTIDTGETGSDTAAAPFVINTSNDDVAENDILIFDVDAVSDIPPLGLIITLEFVTP